MRPIPHRTIFKKGLTTMSEKFIRAEELAEIMEISVPYAYKIIKQLNEELAGVSCSLRRGSLRSGVKRFQSPCGCELQL